MRSSLRVVGAGYAIPLALLLLSCDTVPDPYDDWTGTWEIIEPDLENGYFTFDKEGIWSFQNDLHNRQVIGSYSLTDTTFVLIANQNSILGTKSGERFWGTGEWKRTGDTLIISFGYDDSMVLRFSHS